VVAAGYVFRIFAFCLDRDGAGYDFDTGPEHEHAVEIITLRSPALTEA
jgi:hypothetical protein